MRLGDEYINRVSLFSLLGIGEFPIDCFSSFTIYEGFTLDVGLGIDKVFNRLSDLVFKGLLFWELGGTVLVLTNELANEASTEGWLDSVCGWLLLLLSSVGWIKLFFGRRFGELFEFLVYSLIWSFLLGTNAPAFPLINR